MDDIFGMILYRWEFGTTSDSTFISSVVSCSLLDEPGTDAIEGPVSVYVAQYKPLGLRNDDGVQDLE